MSPTPTNLEPRIAGTERDVMALNRCVFGNGQPPLEDRLNNNIERTKSYLEGRIEQVDRHAKGNIEQGDGDLLELLKHEGDERRTQHKENQQARKEDQTQVKELSKKVDRLMLINATLSGALLTVKFLEDFGIIHLGAR